MANLYKKLSDSEPIDQLRRLYSSHLLCSLRLKSLNEIKDYNPNFEAIYVYKEVFMEIEYKQKKY